MECLKLIKNVINYIINNLTEYMDNKNEQYFTVYTIRWHIICENFKSIEE